MPVIETAACTGCGICADVCVQQIFTRSANGVRVDASRAAGCMACGHCMAACPTKAVRVAGLRYEDFPPLPAVELTPAQLDAFLRARRTIRRFRPDPAPRDVLEEVVGMAATAPVGLPPTAIEVTVVTDPAVLADVAPLALAMARRLRDGLRTPLLGTVIRLSIPRDGREALERKLIPMLDHAETALAAGLDEITWGAPALMLFHAPAKGLCNAENGVIAMTYAMLAAESLGLGSCMSGIIQQLAQRDRRLGARLVAAEQVAPLAGGNVVGGVAGAERLHLRHDREHVVELLGREVRHHGAAMRPRLGEADRLELADGLANRRPRHLEPFGDRRLVEGNPRADLAAHDRIGEAGADALGLGRLPSARRLLAHHGLPAGPPVS